MNKRTSQAQLSGQRSQLRTPRQKGFSTNVIRMTAKRDGPQLPAHPITKLKNGDESRRPQQPTKPIGSGQPGKTTTNHSNPHAHTSQPPTRTRRRREPRPGRRRRAPGQTQERERRQEQEPERRDSRASPPTNCRPASRRDSTPERPQNHRPATQPGSEQPAPPPTPAGEPNTGPSPTPAETGSISLSCSVPIRSSRAVGGGGSSVGEADRVATPQAHLTRRRQPSRQ